MTRAAVIGVGTIGRHHARVYSELDDVELVGVADPDEARRSAAARRHRVPAYASYQELLDNQRPDVITVAVPTVLHREVTLAALDRGVHVLVEKPIAATVAEAQELIDRRARTGLTLAVGHVERFNPAVIELKRRVALGEIGRIFQIHSRRMSPFPSYIRDIGVVMDLATHELDMMRHLIDSPVERVQAETSRNVHERHEDTLVSTLRFRNGVLGSMDVNWITPTKIREFRITGERGMCIADYLGQDLLFYENSGAPLKWDTMALFRGIEEGNVLKIRVAKTEPLRGELRAFVDAARCGKPAPVTGTDGLFALALAEMLLTSAREQRSVVVRDEVARRGWPSVLAPA